MNTQLSKQEMESAWFAYCVDEHAAMLGIAAFEVIDQKSRGVKNAEELVFRYQGGKTVLSQYLCTPANRQLFPFPPADNDPYIQEEMPENCAGFIITRNEQPKHETEFQVVFFSPITPEIEKVRRETLFMTLASLTAEESLVLHTDFGQIIVDRLDYDRFLLCSWADYPQEEFRSFIGDQVETWGRMVELEDRIVRQFKIIRH